MTSEPRATILIVDDNPYIRTGLRELLEPEGYATIEAADGKTALDLLGRHRIDLVLLDLELPRVPGLEVLRQIAERQLDVATVIVSGHGTIRTAVTTTTLGAHDFLEKPVDGDAAIAVVRRVLSQHFGRAELGLATTSGLVGSSEAMRALFGLIARAARSDAKVLLTGESGTGKELTSRAIHANSRRADGPFVALNCAAIPEHLVESELFGHERGSFTGAVARRTGTVELADGGTLFLDEIGDMSLMTQAKLLRVLEDGSVARVGSTGSVPVDFRLIAASNRRLEDAVANGDFREDLLYRLSVIRITLPPLRARREDIPELVDHFLQQRAAADRAPRRRLTPAAIGALLAHDWPGNVRQLRNIVEGLVAMAEAEVLGAREVREALQLPVDGHTKAPAPGLREARADFERAYITHTLEKLGGRVKEAADALGINRSHLWKKMQSLGIHSPPQD